MKKNGDESIKIAHLAMIQAVITRMGSNCFALKALSALLASTSVAVMASMNRGVCFYLLFSLVPIVIFWLMDAKYLKIERAYRDLYDAVRNDKDIENYELGVDRFLVSGQPVLKVACSWSVFSFYGILVFALLLVALSFANSGV